MAGHGEIELALVRLYHKTNNPKYLQVAARYVRNARSMTTAYSPGKPFLADDEAVGHVVAAGYLYSGATDVAVLEGDTELLALLRRKWENVVTRKLYLTGSAGLPRGEAFGAEYELPNAEAYCETCASIALVLWNHRMFLAHGEAKYVDVLERTLYNGVLSGVAMTGERFFYPNPLTVPAARKYERTPWFDCPCCPVNIVRFLPQVPSLVFATHGHEVFVNLYATCSGSVQLADQTVSLAQETRYPWDGGIKITVRPAHPATFTVGMRIPSWANGRPVPSDLYRYAGDDPARAAAVQLKVNGQIVPLDVEHGFARVTRQWKTGDCIELALPMTTRRVIAHEALREDAGRVALERGPLVYCVEAADHNGRVLNLFLPDDAEIADRYRADLLGGVTVLEGQARALVRNPQGQVATEPAAMTAIPYYAWNHRGPGEMTVWIAREAASAIPPPPPPPDTIAGRARATASHCWHRDTLVGLNDGVCATQFAGPRTASSDLVGSPWQRGCAATILATGIC